MPVTVLTKPPITPREVYRLRGLHGVTTDSSGPILRTTLDANVIHLPAALGRRVLEDLRRRVLAGPVMARKQARGGLDRWSVFCWENHTPTVEAVRELDAAGASLCAMGAPLPLPSGYGQIPGEPWWIQPPGADLPGLSVVVAVTRQMARGLGPW